MATDAARRVISSLLRPRPPASARARRPPPPFVRPSEIKHGKKMAKVSDEDRASERANERPRRPSIPNVLRAAASQPSRDTDRARDRLIDISSSRILIEVYQHFEVKMVDFMVGDWGGRGGDNGLAEIFSRVKSFGQTPDRVELLGGPRV